MSYNLCNSAIRKIAGQAISASELLAQCPKRPLKISRTCALVPVRSVARLVPGTKIPYPPVDPKFKAMCAKFQAPNDLPVHLKGGPMDMMLLRLTEVLSLIGTIWWFMWAGERAFKR